MYNMVTGWDLVVVISILASVIGKRGSVQRENVSNYIAPSEVYCHN
jgi:hypothetical protein